MLVCIFTRMKQNIAYFSNMLNYFHAIFGKFNPYCQFAFAKKILAFDKNFPSSPSIRHPFGIASYAFALADSSGYDGFWILAKSTWPQIKALAQFFQQSVVISFHTLIVVEGQREDVWSS